MGYKLKEWRVRRRMSQDDLARKSGVSRATISGLESGRRIDVKTSTLLKICEALNATVDDVFFSNGA